MDFNDTPEEAAFRVEARTWLETNAELLDPGEQGGDLLGERVDDATLKATKAWQKKKADAGWACISWPKEYGGREATAIQSVIWNQEHAKYRTPPNVFGIGLGMCGPTILTHGTPEQRERWIPDLLSGEKLWCQLFSEPSAGSDLAGLRSTAVRDGDDWIINGQKIWTTGAHFCDWGIIVVRSDPTAVKHAGLTYFVVDMHAPGIEIRPITQINGGQGFNEVFFTDVRIPDDQRLDAIGNGWRVALTTLMNERASIGGGRRCIGGHGSLPPGPRPRGRRPAPDRRFRRTPEAGRLLRARLGREVHGPAHHHCPLEGHDPRPRGQPGQVDRSHPRPEHGRLRDGDAGRHRRTDQRRVADAPRSRLAGALSRPARAAHRGGHR
jgi:hypothetical protein